MTAKIWIVVLNWNQPKLTIECLESLQRLEIDKSWEVKIVIVDNKSSDSSVEQFRKLKPGKFGVEILETGANLGFAGGNNVGMRAGLNRGCDYVMILNNDTFVHRKLAVQLVNAIEKDKKIGIVSPKIYFAKGYEFHKKRYKKSDLGKVLWYTGGIIDWKNIYGENRGVDEVDKGQYEKVEEIDFATGACFLVRARALQEVGLFDEKYFMYKEDEDLAVRMKRKGWKIIYEPKGVVWHKVAQSSGIGSNLNDYFISRNILVFGFRYGSLRTKLALMRESLELFIM